MEKNHKFKRMNQLTVIIADGIFPTHHIPLEYIRNSKRIICCDGSAASLVKAGFTPDAIVGDMDSLSDNLAKMFSDRIFKDKSQDTNDLTKAVIWCKERGYNDIVIVGATGKREDHTLGNISLLLDYTDFSNVIMVTDTGTFHPLQSGSTFDSFPGQQISIFAIDPDTEITSHDLRYPLKNTRLHNWWVATLNEALGEKFSVEFAKGKIIVFLKFKDE